MTFSSIVVTTNVVELDPNNLFYKTQPFVDCVCGHTDACAEQNLGSYSIVPLQEIGHLQDNSWNKALWEGQLQREVERRKTGKLPIDKRG